MDFNNKVVLITGSSSGIGEATALKFASLGAVVVITGRDAHKMASVAHKCRHVSAKEVLEVESDLTQESDAAALVETTIGRFGRLDVLVTNEGAVVYHSATDPNLMALFDAAFESGVRAVLRLIALCVPHLQRTKGSVVNVSSSAANKPIPSLMTYCAATSALDMISKCLAIELASFGIRVNCVNPALTRTPLLNYGALSEESAEDVLRNTSQRLRPFQEVEDIANAVVFLSSDKSSFITGIQLPVDGSLLQN